MNCEEIKNLIVRYFDSELNEPEKAFLQHHLGECKTCLSEFKDLEKLFLVLEKENNNLLETKEHYFRNLDPLEIVSKKSKRKWYELSLNPYLSLASLVLIIFLVFFNFSDDQLNQVANKYLQDKNQNLESSFETDSEELTNFYLNEEYLIENAENLNILRSEYFQGIVNSLREMQNQLINNFYENEFYNLNTADLNDDEINEIIAQLETRKF